MADQSLRDVRIEKRQLLEREGVQVHPDRFERTHTLREILELPVGTHVRAAGRVGQLRKFGKLTFATLEDFEGHIQIALLRDELDSDPEVLRFLYRQARTRTEVAESHAQRMALGRKVDRLGYWIAFGNDGGRRGSISPEREEDGEFVGLMMLPTNSPAGSVPGSARNSAPAARCHRSSTPPTW